MTAPDQSPPPVDDPDGAGETGALEAASERDPAAGDPLQPLNKLTEDDAEDS